MRSSQRRESIEEDAQAESPRLSRSRLRALLEEAPADSYRGSEQATAIFPDGAMDRGLPRAEAPSILSRAQAGGVAEEALSISMISSSSALRT